MENEEILARLEELDEETLTHDPATPAGAEALARIRGEMEELEFQLYETCYHCGKPCGNAQGRHYECAVEYGEDLDRTLGFGDAAHIW